MNRQQVKEKFNHLPPKRKQVLIKVLNGYESAKIMCDLNIGKSALDQHLRQLYKDFKISNRQEDERLGEKKRPALIRLFVQTMPEVFTGVTVHSLLSSHGVTVVPESPQTENIYIERPAIEERCYEIIGQLGALIRIKAPSGMGKTWLLDRILDKASQNNYQTVSLSFDLADRTVFSDLTKFSRWFCASVGRQLDLPNELSQRWDDIFGCNENTTTYFEEYLLANLTKPLVLALDKVDRVFEHSQLAEDFCCLLRAWYDMARRSDRRGVIWKQLRLIIVHSTDVYLSLDLNASPLAGVGKVISLPEFTPQQVKELAKHHEIEFSEQQVTDLMSLVGGHPLLVGGAMTYLKQEDISFSQFYSLAPTEEGPFANHLLSHLGNLQDHPELEEAMREVIIAKHPVQLEASHGFKLYSMGLVQLDGNACLPRCDLYCRYFTNRLNIG